MKDYQPTKNNPYVLPKSLYERVLSVIRDYDRRKEEYNDILYGGSAPYSDGVNRKSRAAQDPTADKAARREKISFELHAVDQSLRIVPREYRDGVMANIKHPRSGYTWEHAHRNTYVYWKSRFIYTVAQRLELW